MGAYQWTYEQGRYHQAYNAGRRETPLAHQEAVGVQQSTAANEISTLQLRPRGAARA